MVRVCTGNCTGSCTFPSEPVIANVLGVVFVSPWVAIPAKRKNPCLRLICFPHAGGNTTLYRDWPAFLPDEVEVCAAVLPGRETRFSEPLIDQMQPLVSGLLDGIAGLLDRPVALFGHSMGALIAFELACRLRERGQGIRQLIVSGCPAPQVGVHGDDLHRLSDEDLVNELARMNGTPNSLIDNIELMRLAVPIIRNDFRLAETYFYLEQPPLDCPITCFGGTDDPNVTAEDLCAWSVHTTNGFRAQFLRGDHFFLVSRPADFVKQVLAEALA